MKKMMKSVSRGREIFVGTSKNECFWAKCKVGVKMRGKQYLVLGGRKWPILVESAPEEAEVFVIEYKF